MMKRRLLILWLILGLAYSVNAQERWHMEDVQNAAELFETNVSNITLSPDGTMLAGTGSTFITDHHAGQICVLTLATGEQTCFSTEDKLGVFTFAPGYNPLVWSPDSTTLLLAENPLEFMAETDLWALDVDTGELTNLTDDGMDAEAPRQSRSDAVIDYFPAYAPNGDIYFFRAYPSAEDDLNYTLTLQRLAVGADAPELITDAFSNIPVYWTGIDASPAISPDGRLLVFPVDNSRYAFPVADSDVASQQDGLWLVELMSGEARQLTDANGTPPGLPESDQDADMQTLHPVWAADGAGIVFRTASVGGAGTFLYVDVATGDASPVIETDMPESLPLHEGAVSTDGTAFVYLRHDADADTAQIAAAPLPPDGGDPVVIGEVEYTPSSYAVPNPTMSADDKTLLGGWLYMFEH